MAKPTGKLIRITPELVGALPTGGTAVAATKLATPRKINGVAFDGTGDINLTPANIGALTDAQAAQKYAYRSIKVNGQPLSADVNLLAGDVNAWNKTEADGRYLLKAATAAAATKLATPRKINGVPFDGSVDINLTPSTVGVYSKAEVDALLPKRSTTENDFIRIPDVPGGLIIQWGRFYISANGLKVIFPTPFINSVPTLIMGAGEDATGYAEIANFVPDSVSKTGFTVNATVTSTYSFIAIGN